MSANGPLCLPAKVAYADISIERGIPAIAFVVSFDFGDYSQGFARVLVPNEVKRFIEVCCADKLSQVRGTVLMVTHTRTDILSLKAMPFDKNPDEYWELEYVKVV